MQGAPYSARSTQGASVPARPKQGAPVPVRYKQRAPVPARSEKGDLSSSLVFGDASENAQRRSQHSDFSDATLKSTKEWRQNTMQRAPFSARSTQGAPVPASSEKGDLTSSLDFSDSSEKAPNSGFTDATQKTKKKTIQGQLN